MKVELIRYTPEPDELGGRAAAKCYRGKNFEKSMQSAMDSGHFGVLEHEHFTFEVSGVSRVLLAQITRHRLASFAVESQRYCGVKPEWILPDTILDVGYEREFKMICDAAYELMCEMMAQGNVPAEDARYVIPQAVECSFIMTMNARELLHFFELRCCKRAQWEIRELAWAMLKECRKAAPKTFEYAGPGCLYKSCPEGKRSCGKPYTEEDAFEET